VKRLASYFHERRTKVSDRDYAPLSVTKNGILPQMENVAKTNDGDNRKLVKVNDFVINSRSDRRGSSGVSKFDGSVSLINIVLEPRQTLSSSFCDYLLKSQPFIEEYYRNGHGIVADLWTTRYDEMKLIKLAIPPLSEQRAMAAYLDRVTAEIDRAIGQQQRLIDLLTERKQIIIQRTVTRGLDPNATNVEWIPLRYVFEIRNGYTPSKKVSAYWTGGNIPWFRMEDIRKSGRILSDSIQHITSKAIKGKGLFKANSFILATTATIGEHALLIADSLANQRFTNLKICKSPSDRFDIKFLFYYMFVIGDWCKTSVNTTCFSSVDIGELKAQRIPLYSLSEQRTIAEYLDRATAKIDAAIARQQKMIDLLTERKQIIVSEVVTGRINVSNGEQIKTEKV